jgi:hypothetical protein
MHVSTKQFIFVSAIVVCVNVLYLIVDVEGCIQFLFTRFFAHKKRTFVTSPCPYLQHQLRRRPAFSGHSRSVTYITAQFDADERLH